VLAEDEADLLGQQPLQNGELERADSCQARLRGSDQVSR
jgi:hypothetical protein